MGWVMVMADNDKSDNGYLKYYIHGNEYLIKYPNEVNYLQSKDCRLSVGFRKLHFLFHRMLQYPTLVKQASGYLQHPPQT